LIDSVDVVEALQPARIFSSGPTFQRQILSRSIWAASANVPANNPRFAYGIRGLFHWFE
jgi:hypothetical protein